VRRLIIDVSSILRACHHVGKDHEFGFNVEFEGEQVWVNSAHHAYTNFISAYAKVLREHGFVPRDTVLVLDGKDSRALRRAIFAGYKSKRTVRPPEFFKEYNKATDKVVDELMALGALCVHQDVREADDVIAYLVENLTGEKVVWSRDADMLALQRPGVDILYNDQLNPEIFGKCPAKHILVYKSLVGDRSDCIPGAKGFGEESFFKMLVEFGVDCLPLLDELIRERRLHELEEDVADFKPLQRIIDNAEMVYTSYACARFYPEKINTKERPLEIRARAVEPRDEWHPLLEKWAPTKTLIDIKSDISWVVRELKKSSIVALDIETSTPEESDAWVARLMEIKKSRKKGDSFVDVFGSQLTGLSLTFGENCQHTVYFTVDHAYSRNIPSERVADVIAEIPENVPVVVHNSSFELPVLYNEWGAWIENVYDTLLMKSYVDENTSLGLKYCSKRYLKYKQATYEETTGGKKMRELSPQHVFDYACDDTICTAALFNRFRFTMELEHTWEVFKEVELEVQYLVADTFVRGIDIDLNRLRELEAEDSKAYQEHWKVIREHLRSLNWPGFDFVPFELTPNDFKRAYQLVTGEKLKTRFRKLDKIIDEIQAAGVEELAEVLATGDLDKINDYLVQFHEAEPEFELNKDADIRKLVYDTWGLPIRFRTRPTEKMRKAGKQGTPQVDAYAFNHMLKLDLADDPEKQKALEAIIECKHILTRFELYYRPYPRFIHWKDGKIHPFLGQCRTATRRYAPSAVNVNQLPKRGEGLRVRELVVPPKGYILVAMDWSGQELRLAADESQDKNMLACYIGDDLKDIHSLTAAGIAAKHGKDIGDYELFEERRAAGDAEAKAYRDKGKSVNFSSQYLCMAPKLAKMLVVSVEEAQEFLDAKNEVYSGLHQWQMDSIADAYEKGYSVTRLGARRHLWHKLSAPDKFVRAEAERQAVNYRIQGSGAEMVKLSLTAMSKKECIFDKYGVLFMFPVHDEVVLAIPEENLVPALQAAHACMVQQYADMQVPLESEISIGYSFGKLVTVGTEPTEEAITTALKALKEKEVSG
jgi:DNA polymerase I-like protein with 3'-5' exonuclease and polymerase domains